MTSRPSLACYTMSLSYASMPTSPTLSVSDSTRHLFALLTSVGQVHTESEEILSAGYIPRHCTPLSALESSAYAHFAQTADGVLVGNDRHPSLSSLCSVPCVHASQLFPHSTLLKQIVAYDTGFAALTEEGHVYTWGDERYSACLGRDLTDSATGTAPGLVSDLVDLPTGPITRVAAGGYILAALTAGKDLYIWGHAGRAAAAGLSRLEVTDVPTPVVIEDHDIVDVAVGEGHMIILTATGEVYAIGSNSNGQLGLGVDVKGVDSWTRVIVGGLQELKGVVGVAAGPTNSFLIVHGPNSL